MEKIEKFRNQKITLSQQREILGGDTNKPPVQSNTSTINTSNYTEVTDHQSSVYNDSGTLVSCCVLTCEK